MIDHLVSESDVQSPQPIFQFNNSAASASPVAVKSSAGRLFWLQIDNSLNNIQVFLQIWNLAVGSVVGSTPADEVVSCPPGLFRAVEPPLGKGGFTANFSTGVPVKIFDYVPIPGSSLTTVVYMTGANPGKVFSTAITAAVTTSLVGAVSPTNPVSLTVCYQ